MTKLRIAFIAMSAISAHRKFGAIPALFATALLSLVCWSLGWFE